VFLLALILLFVAIPFAELYVIIKVWDAIGPAPTILLLGLSSLLGVALMRSQGRNVWRNFNEAIRAGTIPHREIVDGGLVTFGGALLIAPGFLTDVLGLLLLLPPTRALFRRSLQRRLRLRAESEVSARRSRPRQDYDVEGTAAGYEADVPRGAGDPRRRRLER
jgi:UPF0716 protein FxsA